VFDGKHPPEKEAENQRRKRERDEFLQHVDTTREQIKRRKIDCGFDPERSIDAVSTDNLSEDLCTAHFELQRMEDDLEKEWTSKPIVLPQYTTEVKKVLFLY
jgi:hypothetical protein